jgi:hypothetical protein
MNLSSNSQQLSTFTSNENKGLLWSVLHGGGKFNSVPDASLKKVQIMFETTLNEMNETFQKTNQSIDLNVMNKEAVYAICKKLDNLMAEESKKLITDQKKQQQIPQLETVYRAEDIQKERQSAFNMELKKKEEEMSSIIKLRKPDEIKFSDDVYDKPIGDDMERLLAETLASRERELEQLNNSTGKEDKNAAEKWINPNSNADFQNHTTTTAARATARAVTATDGKKKVSFNNVQTEHEPIATEATETTETTESTESTEATEATLDLNALMTKFKKINTTTENTNKTSIQNNQNQNSQIIKISEDVAFIKQSIIELTEKINESILNQRR